MFALFWPSLLVDTGAHSSYTEIAGGIMVIKVGRKLRTADYEMIDFEITVSSEDIPQEEGESLEKHTAKLHYLAYRQALAFEVFHQKRQPSSARQELARFRQAYKMEE
jgi:hypothetical protein